MALFGWLGVVLLAQGYLIINVVSATIKADLRFALWGGGDVRGLFSFDVLFLELMLLVPLAILLVLWRARRSRNRVS
ncbi:hypothetical protein [Rhizomicrobium electricum]|uniref:hypothetical protein n=1 Tax=Rhizomicrobium electricum TaxID=480070 RepID=UPI00141EA10B|nr:hypothetical protein [Rhizomicrobium electricum]NIJ50551.1 hypothetical protein [Rhizomicrobium electricum]